MSQQTQVAAPAVRFRPTFVSNDSPTARRNPASRTSTSTVVPTGKTPGTAQDRPLRITFEIHESHAPALRSAIEEISNEVGGRLEGMYQFPVENALTAASVALGSLRAAVNAVVPAGDRFYRGRSN